MNEMPEQTSCAAQAPTSSSPLMDSREAAEILGVCPRTVARMCEDGTIKAVKVRSLWRINRAYLLEYAGLV